MDLAALIIAGGGSIAAALAALFSWRAVRAARETIELERSDIEARRRERLLRLLQDLEESTFDWGQTASEVHHGGQDRLAAPRTRARYQVAYRAAVLEFNLPINTSLSRESDVTKIVTLHQQALDEIREKREKLILADHERI